MSEVYRQLHEAQNKTAAHRPIIIVSSLILLSLLGSAAYLYVKTREYNYGQREVLKKLEGMETVVTTLSKQYIRHIDVVNADIKKINVSLDALDSTVRENSAGIASLKEQADAQIAAVGNLTGELDQRINRVKERVDLQASQVSGLNKKQDNLFGLIIKVDSAVTEMRDTLHEKGASSAAPSKSKPPAR